MEASKLTPDDDHSLRNASKSLLILSFAVGIRVWVHLGFFEARQELVRDGTTRDGSLNGVLPK